MASGSRSTYLLYMHTLECAYIYASFMPKVLRVAPGGGVLLVVKATLRLSARVRFRPLHLYAVMVSVVVSFSFASLLSQ